jgi:hypothetical protein
LIQQALQTKSTQSQATAGHHHHHGGDGSGSEIGQLLDQLGTELQSGNLSTAQGIFITLQQDLQDSSQNSGQTSSRSGANGVCDCLTPRGSLIAALNRRESSGERDMAVPLHVAGCRKPNSLDGA